MTGRTIFLSCGEASGERYALELARTLRERRPELRLVGIGSAELERQGVELWADRSELGMMGFGEVLKHLPRLWALRRRLVQRAMEEGVDLFLPVDFPGFHISLARQLRDRGVAVLDFVPPKTWSWGSFRLRSLRGAVDRCAVMFPFEVEHYRSAGIDARFVGHPLLDSLNPERSERDGSLLLVPGSRRQELSLLAPLMGRVAAQLGGTVRVSQAPGVERDWLQPILDQCPAAELSREPLMDELARGGLALVTSGTASLEAALAGIPHVIVYRTGALSYWIARRLATVEHIGMANIVLGRRAYPEFLQRECLVETVAAALEELRSSAEARAAQSSASVEIRECLGGPGAIGRLSDLALEMLDGYTAAAPKA